MDLPTETLNKIKSNVDPIKEILPDENDNWEEIEHTNQCDTISKESPEIDAMHTMPKLHVPFKRPNVIWHQNKSVVVLKISAADVKDYILKVTNRTLYFR